MLINPEAHFDALNMKIHGISPRMVSGAPTFKEAWKELSPFFSGIILGHNCKYDLSVICKTLQRYEIEIPNIQYACTMELSKIYNDLKTHSLQNLCNNYGVSLPNHHNALCDAVACQEVFTHMVFQHPEKDGFVKEYIYDGVFEEKAPSAVVDKAKTDLCGILQGMRLDNTINLDEIPALTNWIDSYEIYKNASFFSEVIPELKRIISLGSLSETSFDGILLSVSAQINESAFSIKTVAEQVLSGMAKGVLADNKINDLEIINFKKWLDKNLTLLNNHPFNKVYSLCCSILADGIITEDERKEFEILLRNIVEPACLSEEIKVGEITYKEKVFCLSGDFLYGKKSDVAENIQILGGICKATVTKATNYLIVGGAGSDNWKFGNYGCKVMKALEMQEKGIQICILKEADLKI